MGTKFSLIRNSLWNLLGQGAPLLVALFTIPPLLHGLGTERFGLLTILWLLIGYFSLFDFGLGRALTQLVSKNIGLRQEQKIPSLVWSAMALMASMGIIGSATIVATFPTLVRTYLKIPEHLQGEAISATYALAIAIPFVVTTTGISGILAAKQRFKTINMLRIPLGIYTFVAPLLLLQVSANISHIAWLLTIGRMLFLALHILACIRAIPGLKKPQFDFQAVKPLFRLGTWMTVSNVIGPLMVSLDRLIIGATLSMAAVTYYATPYEMVTKLWIIPSAIVGAIFPAFASLYATDKHRAAEVCDQGIRHIILLMFPAILGIIVFADQGLSIWLGPEFAAHSTTVLQWLAVGVFLNSLCQVPFSLIQGAARPDITAKLHLIQLPIYLATLWMLMQSSGIKGAAIAWTGRILFDAALLSIAVIAVLPEVRSIITKYVRYTVVLLALLSIGALAAQQKLPLTFFFLSISFFLAFAWTLLISGEEKHRIKNYCNAKNPAN